MTVIFCIDFYVNIFSSFQILQRAPHAPIEPKKYGGCGECIEINKHLKLQKQISNQNDILTNLIQIWINKIKR